MRGEVIALDVETTGLDPDEHEIIEIGIARCRDNDILETYQKLIRPSGEIPPHITGLTGISNHDVHNAPSLYQLLPEIREFIGDRPIIGQRIEFDLAFLRRFNVASRNLAIDTYELAAALLPTAPRYNLSSLVQHLNLTLDNAHRALDDAVACWRVYRRLWDMLLEMPLALLDELLDHAAALEWYAKPALEEAFALRQERGESVGAEIDFEPYFDSISFEQNMPKLGSSKTRQELDTAKLAQMIGPQGPLAQTMDGYEVRESQIEMLKMVAEAFNNDQHIMIEAPTGTGKSLAYLLPAITWATQNNERVVISTHTLTLQDQLLNKDIPLLQEHLGLRFTAAALKGRVNYLCPRRLSTLRHRKPTTTEELRILAKVLVWMSSGQATGQKNEINLRGSTENAMWARLSAQDEDCSLEQCELKMKGICPFLKARDQAEKAHILVVNHALLLSDVVLGNRVLPNYDYLVLDEAHHLENAITEGLSYRLDKLGLLRKMADFGGPDRGMLGDLLKTLRGKISQKSYDGVADYVKTMSVAIRQMGKYLRSFFDETASALEEFASEAEAGEERTLRVTPEARDHRNWSRIAAEWDNLSPFIETLSDAMDRISMNLSHITAFAGEQEELDALVSSTRSSANYLNTLWEQFNAFVYEPDANTIYWVERWSDGEQIVLNAAPLYIGDMVDKYLWKPKKVIILTSATLRTAGSFDYLDQRLKAEHIDHAAVPSPFDYSKSTLVYLPNDIPEPTQRREYQTMLERGIIELATVSGGRMLCLFTSYDQLRETAQNVAPRLALGGIQVLDQSMGSSQQLLLDSFLEAEKAVLMGTKSFWEGVDIPGEDLSVLVIARLPFAVPSDPIFAARSEVYAENSFMEYSMPDAILRFRQGFGRLIRRKDDRGVVVIFDRRITSKRYGQLFLDSLPDVTIERGPLARLPHAAKQWLEK